MVLAMAWPCAGPRSNVRRISRSRVPCSSSMRSFCSLVDILGENKPLPVECQCESPHDKSRIVEASEEPYSTLWALISITGCRAGEILGLKTTGLDFEKHLIRIRRTLDHATRTMQAPKSRSSSADLPMPELLEKRLRTFLATHSYLRLRCRRRSARHLRQYFAAMGGRPFRPSSIMEPHLIHLMETTLR